ncbi:MAG: YncE family protein [Thermomicrobiales bacterium]
MRPPPVLHRLLVLSLLALLAGAWAPVLSTAAVPAAVRERTIVVVKDRRVTRLVDPATGTTLWEVNTWAAAALGPDGTLYLGVDRDGGSDVFAFALGDPKPTLVSDSAPDGALVAGVSPSGDRLWLLTYDYEGRQRMLPTALTALPLPADRVVPDGRPRAYRYEAGGILRSDGRRWYGYDPTADPVQFAEVLFRDGKPLEATPLPDAIGSVHLLSPGGHRIYVVSYPRQTITVVDTAAREVVHTVDLGRKRSKAPACAAVLSPGGSRLYMVAREGNAPLGIDVYETATFERVARFVPGRSFYCLAISPDGERLYADDDRALVTIDAATGEELAAVPLERRDVAPPYLDLATSTG